MANEWAQVMSILKAQIDVTSGYNNGNDLTINAEALSETMLHEQVHAAHYNKVGNAWWADFVNAELQEMATTNNPPYGNGNTANSPLIALGESWGFYMGHFLTNMKYGGGSVGWNAQGFFYGNGVIRQDGVDVAITGLNAHLNLLEDFSPLRGVDPFRWIPRGLYYDLLDNRNDNLQTPVRVPLVDDVLNYSNESFFNALDADIRSLPNYRTRLLSENGNSQAGGVNTIFNFYGF